MATVNAPDVFGFTDYREYLRQYAREKQQTNPKWTYGLWARRLGFKGTASLTMIINGQRNPGPRVIRTFAKYFNFSEKQRCYFLGLVQLEKTRDYPQERLRLIDQLRQLSPLPESNTLPAATEKLLSSWSLYAIRQMLRLHDFQQDPAWIAARLRPALSEAQIERALNLLLAADLIEGRKNGKLYLKRRTLRTSNDTGSNALKQIHLDLIDLGKDALQNVPSEEREIRGVTMSIRKSKLKEAKELLRRFTTEFDRLIDHDGGDEVYQLNLQFFPLTKSLKRESV